MRLIAALLLLTLQDPKVDLKWKFSKDAQLRWEMAQKLAIESDSFGSEQEITYTLKQTVKSVGDKGAELETTIEALKFKLTGAMGESEYDSSKDKKAPDDPIGGALAVMSGKTYSMTVDASGTVTGIKGFDAIVQKMTEGLDADAEMAKGMIQQLFNDGVQTAMLQMAFVQLPREPVAAGGSWKNEFSLDMPVAGSLKFAIDGKLKAVRKGGDGGEAEIEQDVKVTAGEGAGGMLELKGSKGTRKAVFHIEQGQLKSSALDVELQLKMADSELPLKIEMKMKPLPANVASKDDKK